MEPQTDKIQKREELKIKQQEDEFKKNCTFKPRTTKTPKRVLVDSSDEEGDVVNRLYKNASKLA